MHGVSRFQGWYFSVPMPAALVKEALRSLAPAGARLCHDELRAQLHILRDTAADGLRAVPGS
jgi:hypothetical protein